MWQVLFWSQFCKMPFLITNFIIWPVWSGVHLYCKTIEKNPVRGPERVWKKSHGPARNRYRSEQYDLNDFVAGKVANLNFDVKQ